MKKRVISSAVLVVLVAAVAVLYSPFPWILPIVTSLIAAAAVYELAAAAGFSRRPAFLLPCLLLALAVPFMPDARWLAFVLFAFTVLFFAAQLRCNSEVSFREAGVLYGMSLFIPCALRSLVALEALGGDYGLLYVVLGIAAAWISDVGAFCAGKLFGKHKLCPRVSPKKTVEGAAGGFCLNLLFMLLVGVLAPVLYGGARVSLAALLLLAAGGTAISILGDLSFSLVKRGCGIKDFGKVIPGHGGILDRFDGVIFTAPYAYFLLSVLPVMLPAV